MELYSNDNQFHEVWPPIQHVAPDSLKNKILFKLRLFFDLQVFTIYCDIKRELKYIKNDVLEIGCGLQPYRHLILREAKYYALEKKGHSSFFPYNPNTIEYGGGTFPFKDKVFNLVFHTEVLEHVYDFTQFLSECHRVLAEKGRMFFTIPFAVRYHYIPNDYWRLTPASIEKLLKKANFKNIIVKNRGSDIVVAFSKLNALFYRIIFRGYNSFLLRIINQVFFGILFIIPIMCLTFSSHLLILLKIGSPDDPLGYTVYCEK
ncbi:MAG: hypothetical protein A2Z72_04225 [Omnitrophica bacterium RBG_13_46_9]|nr:MAG: hypothetical protein A2Z72_04225 [Omnitrophica bacterium RBG_13_46_9]